jgi:hypothetical protein
VPKQFFTPPEHLIDQWPEIFKDMPMSSMPVAYLNKLKLEFVDGRIWEFSVDNLLSNHTATEVSNQLISILEEYQDDIIKIDFKLDIDKLKSEIASKTKDIL